MVGINSGESPFTGEILHYDLHKRGITGKKMRERKKSSACFSMLGLDERLVVIQVKIGLLEPFFAKVWDFSGFGYRPRGELEIKACHLEMFAFEPQGV